MSAPSPTPDTATSPAVGLTVPPMNDVVDLHGDPLTADLVLFMNGNQFMVMDELIEAFELTNPDVHDVFFETIPPGKLLEQARAGVLQMGALRLSVKPDVLAAGPRALQPLYDDGIIERPVVYATNDLAILVTAGNPLGITGLADLARPEVRIAMPNLQFEGVAELIGQALEKAGGPELRHAVMIDKVADGKTRWTQIHHRESAMWLEAGEVDACPLWSTEARYHCENRKAPMETVRIAPEHNVIGKYGISRVRGCAHPQAASSFIDFLLGAGRDIYAHYGFAGPEG